MFGTKKGKSKKDGEHLNVSVTSIPDIFYGGQNPNVYQAGTHVPEEKKKDIPVKKKMRAPSASPAKKHVYGSKKESSAGTKAGPKAGADIPHHKPSVWRLLMSHKTLLIGIAVFLLGVGIIVWYYTRDLGVPAPAPVAQVTPPPAPSIPVREEPVQREVPAPAEPEEEEVVEEPQSRELEFPQFSLVNTVDTDSDELTDLEEALFGTDTGVWDNDEDSYFDGQEIVNLYDPAAPGGAKLIDSSFVREFIHEELGYALYYPSSWLPAQVDEETQQVLISAGTGEYVSIRVEDRVRGQDFTRWFAAHARGQRIRDVETAENVFDVGYKLRRDHLVGYIEEGDSVYVITYHAPDQGPIRYRNVMRMMLSSFRPPQVVRLLDREASQAQSTPEESQSTVETPDENVAL